MFGRGTATTILPEEALLCFCKIESWLSIKLASTVCTGNSQDATQGVSQ